MTGCHESSRLNNSSQCWFKTEQFSRARDLSMFQDICSPSWNSCVQIVVRGYMQSISPLRLFVITLPILAVTYQLLTCVGPHIVRLLVPDSLRVVLTLL
jgi:hypothetical protein